MTTQKFSHAGPWDHEPDELDWTDEKTGLLCRAIRNVYGGHLCGYVQIPEAHPLHGMFYSADLPESMQPFWDSIMEGPVGKRGAIDVFCMAGGMKHPGFLFNVHGGVTFSGELSGRDGYWYGFDCAHCDDLSPQRASLSDFAYGEYRDIEYVKAECASLAQQLRTLAA